MNTLKNIKRVLRRSIGRIAAIVALSAMSIMSVPALAAPSGPVYNTQAASGNGATHLIKTDLSIGINLGNGYRLRGHNERHYNHSRRHYGSSEHYYGRGYRSDKKQGYERGHRNYRDSFRNGRYYKHYRH